MLCYDNIHSNFNLREIEMNDALSTLEAEYSANENRLSVVLGKIENLQQEAESIKINNQHLAYSIELIKKQINKGTRLVGVVVAAKVNKPEEVKKTLRSVLLDLAASGKSITVVEAWEFAKEQGFDATREVVNSTLYRLASSGYLMQPETGLYKKAS